MLSYYRHVHKELYLGLIKFGKNKVAKLRNHKEKNLKNDPNYVPIQYVRNKNKYDNWQMKYHRQFKRNWCEKKCHNLILGQGNYLYRNKSNYNFGSTI